MLYLKYKNFDDIYYNLSRLPLLEYDKYKNNLKLSGSTYYMNNIVIEVPNFYCSLDMSKLNYTILKWKILVNKYIDKSDYFNFKEKLINNRSKSCTFNFKIHQGEKDGCLVALVVTRNNSNTPWENLYIYYRVTEVYKKFPVDLILFNKICNELPNCNFTNIIFHIPEISFRQEFLTELIGSGYFTLEEFTEDNFATNRVKELWNKYYTKGAELSKYHSIARKQKLKKRSKFLDPIPIESLKLF